ncbi:MAG: EAL domain-containing protein [Clostridiales bacterium]|nr:EAL domain-containing protein [Clostridiales bacterium]
MKLAKKFIVFFGSIWILSTLAIIFSSSYVIKFIQSSDIEKNLKILFLFIIIFNAIILVIIYIVTRKLIGKKVSKLNYQINQINTTSNPQERLTEIDDNDEFGQLARDINTIFQSIEDTNDIVVSNEKKYSTLVEGLNDGYAYFKILKDNNGAIKDAFIVELNASLAEMIGKSKENLLTASFKKLFEDYVKDKDVVQKILRHVGGKNQSVLKLSVRLGVDRWAYLTVYPIETEYFAMILTDISENRKYAEEMKRIANYDVLTNIQNRFSLYNYLDELALKNEKFAVYYIDLDNFKTINDTLGHNVGDEVLIRAAETLDKIDNDNFIIGRLGGDEFLGILKGEYTIHEVESFGHKIIHELNSVESYNKYPYKINASLGASRFPIDSNDIEALLKCADVAMYKSKNSGGNKINVFNEIMEEEAKIQMSLKKALSNEEIFVEFQPIYSLKQNQIVGAEALCRWMKDGEVIIPDRFIPSAKRTGDIVNIDNYIFNEAVKFCSNKRKEQKEFKVAINVSKRFLLQNKLVDKIKTLLKDNNLEPSAIRIEILEEEFLDDVSSISSILEEIRKLGVEITLDDFGAGYSNFKDINMLPITSIKIDRSLLKKIEKDLKTVAIISALLKLANTLNLEVIASGIEYKEQLDLLKKLHVDKIQGFLIHEPVEKEKFPNEIFV